MNAMPNQANESGSKVGECRQVVAPRWQAQVEAAIVVLACGAAGTGIRTKLTLMHPEAPGDDRQLFDAFVQKRAANVMFEFVMAACEALPPLSATIQRRLAELASSEQGLTERGDKTLFPKE